MPPPRTDVPTWILILDRTQSPWRAALFIAASLLGTACTSPLGAAEGGTTAAVASPTSAPVETASPVLPPADAPAVPDPEPFVQIPGTADLDPQNDFTVAPPAEIDGCEDLLTAAGVTYRRAELPVHKKRGNTFDCGTPQAVSYVRGPGKLKYGANLVVGCGMALALARFENIVQEEAQKAFGLRVVRVSQVGTYSCRKMAEYPDWVSEHSYANALDVTGFQLSDGRWIKVLSHYDSERATRAKGRAFLRSLARRLYAEDVFSCVLTPAFDARHADHFHLDLARYRVNGTAPGP